MRARAAARGRCCARLPRVRRRIASQRTCGAVRSPLPATTSSAAFPEATIMRRCNSTCTISTHPVSSRACSHPTRKSIPASRAMRNSAPSSVMSGLPVPIGTVKSSRTHYSYPWNQAGSQYNYDEVDLEVAYRGWLDLRLGLFPRLTAVLAVSRGRSPSAPNRQSWTCSGPWWGSSPATRVSATTTCKGANATGYTYWSAGAAYDWAPVILAVSYVRTSAAANALFYNAAVGGRWTGTVIWRF